MLKCIYFQFSTKKQFAQFLLEWPLFFALNKILSPYKTNKNGVAFLGVNALKSSGETGLNLLIPEFTVNSGHY